jgi:hypothetical protein
MPRTRWLIAGIVVVLGVAGVAGYAATRSDSVGAARGWGERWPLRGDLAGSDDVLRDAVAHRPPGDDPHLLWAGTIGSVRQVVIAYAGGAAYVLAGADWKPTRLGQRFDVDEALLRLPGGYFLAAAGARVTVHVATDTEPATSTDVAVRDGMGYYRPVQPCRGFVTEVQTPGGASFSVPWTPAVLTRAELERAARDVDRAAAIAGGLANGPECGGQQPFLSGWQFGSAGTYTPHQVIVPGAGDGWVILLDVRQGDTRAATLMFLPKDGRAAHFGTPIRGEPHGTGSDHQFATLITGLTKRADPAVLVYCGCRVTSDPPLPVVVASPAGGATVLGAPRTASILRFLAADGSQLSAQTIVRTR